MQRALGVVLAVWAGSLWTICGIVAPSLFAVVADRHLAGQVAGYFFRLETWLGVALGSIAFLLMRRVIRSARLDYALLGVTTLAPLIGELAIRPLMDNARDVGDMARFGMLHGASALLFALACVAILMLVVRTSAPNKSVSDNGQRGQSV